MAIHVIQSQRIEVLVDCLIEKLKSNQSTNALSVLQERHIVVPDQAIAAWLEKQIAEKISISANIKHHRKILGLQWKAYDWALPNKQDRERIKGINMPPLIMQWRIYNVLAVFIAADQFDAAQMPTDVQPLVQRIFDSTAQLSDRKKREQKRQEMLYWIAAQVTRLFTNYMAFRGSCIHTPDEGVEHWICPHCDTDWLKAWSYNQPLNIMQLTGLKPEQADEYLPTQARQLEHWQRWLWHQVFQKDFNDRQEIDNKFWFALARAEQNRQQQFDLDAEDDERDDDERHQTYNGLPEQIFVFTTLELPPAQLKFLYRLAAYTEVHLLYFNPSREYWADMVDPVWKDRYNLKLQQRYIERNPNVSTAQIQAYLSTTNAEFRESQHSLLTRLGKRARDNFALLVNMSGGEGWEDIFPDTEPTTLLAQIQYDIMTLEEPEQHQYALAGADESIQFHVCHSSLRQLEVLREQLVHWLADGTEQEPRHPSDILVLVPNLKELEPHIRTVFSTTRGMGRSAVDLPYIPVKIAGVVSQDIQNAWQAFVGRIEISQGRFTAEDFHDWLNLNAVQELYQLDHVQMERMMELLIQAGFRRGLDEQHMLAYLSEQDRDYRYTFKFALDRLALGIAIPQHAVFEDTLSFAGVSSSDFELVQTLIQIYRDISARRDWLNPNLSTQTVKVWLQQLDADLKPFVEASGRAFETIRSVMRAMTQRLHNAQSDKVESLPNSFNLPLSLLLKEIQQGIDSSADQIEPTGSVTFADMGKIRQVPFSLVVLMNMDSGKFPRRDQQVPFDLMDVFKPVLGDRSRLEDDKGAFLDALLFARQSLWIFYNGFDVNDGESREPSSVIYEFSQFLARMIQPQQLNQPHDAMLDLDGLRIPQQLEPLYHIYPLQPFDPMGFQQSKNLRYKDQWFAVAEHILDQSGQRQSWINRDYPVHDEQEVRVLDGQEWIKDVVFPARAYLKTLGVASVYTGDQLPQQEPLLLDRLQQYHVRDLLQKHYVQPASRVHQAEDQNSTTPTEPDMALFQDVLPVGHSQIATWKLSLQEQAQLLERLDGRRVTVTTLQNLQLEPHLILSITVPEDSQSMHWLSCMASGAKPKRQTQTWLEYLLWLSYLDLGDEGATYRREVICNDKSIVCCGLSSAQAKLQLSEWVAMWKHAQKRPVVLPAALIRQEKCTWVENETGQLMPDNFAKLQEEWLKNHSFGGVELESNEANSHHRDWSFILQQQAADELLALSCRYYAERLYHVMDTEADDGLKKLNVIKPEVKK
ncbi:exodeoxyribonuclease V subunit gamma [Acinetobacter sp. YH12063]|uniref:exodeoxyribonuclease V subunit gamma n=1 Tax=Acinetobacter sp. YH12063 TaxID=2601061 RepID=UPI0015D1A750|nr:exodeoxyribonuclease V subunit gamma [Acinetobacter sp. YH12063]